MSSLQATKHRRPADLRGPRPSPLSVNSNSHKIQKPPQAPVVIYVVSPKVIHVQPAEFMGLVQRLTGLPSDSERKDGGSDREENTERQQQFPVRVKARSLNTIARGISEKSPKLFLRDLSPPASRNWLVHGDCMAPGTSGLSPGFMNGSPSYLDIIGQVGEQ